MTTSSDWAQPHDEWTLAVKFNMTLLRTQTRRNPGHEGYFRFQCPCLERSWNPHLRSLSQGNPAKDAQPAALKECWRDSDRDREIQSSNKYLPICRIKKGLRGQDFLTVLAAANVMANRKIDGTDNLLRMSDLPTDCTWYPLPAEGPKAKPTRTGEGLTPSFPCVPGSAKQLKVHSIHSRLVFKEVCQPTYEFGRLDTVFETLQDARKALQILYSVDWAHRDVSAGNVLRVGQMGKLADLEYARRMDSKTTHEVRTGTLEFMAGEVKAQKYLFTAHRPEPKGRTFKPSFKFNPLHDMESIWWIPIWVLYCQIDPDSSQRSAGQSTRFDGFYRGRLDSRFPTFSARMVYQVLPNSFNRAADEVEYMYEELLNAYTKSEEEMPPAEKPAYTEPLANLHSVFT
ncbi:hypothetical protein EDC04DRAFT_668792 [Pisolithus marmoratus]|nr:hypothetical protein EDC04DRAFT_668792 [Pisolithus marmoratus]